MSAEVELQRFALRSLVATPVTALSNAVLLKHCSFELSFMLQELCLVSEQAWESLLTKVTLEKLGG